jgi:homocysteine S-methyltransferase
MIKLDGGLSTALESNGNKLTTSLWTGQLIRSNPAEITKAHLDFINSGAEIIITSAYQLSYPGCGERGWYWPAQCHAKFSPPDGDSQAAR